MKIGILPFSSALHDADKLHKAQDAFINTLQQHVACEYTTEENLAHYDLLLILILTGGSEGLLVKAWPGLQALQKPMALVATLTDNSLPAAIEILTWLRQQEKSTGMRIFHGTNKVIAAQIGRFVAIQHIIVQLRKQVVGVIGEPSDWLIASMPELAVLTGRFGLSFKNITMAEFNGHCDKPDSAALADFSTSFYALSPKEKTADLVRAAKIYAGLIRCIRFHHLTALTLRCFDILSDKQTTGCLGIAKLNDDGIPASCEGDIPALLTMLLIKLATGKPSFMANPSRLSADEVTLAHCTCPVSMVNQVTLKTHFESGRGLAISGTFPETVYTLLKLDLHEFNYALQTGEVIPLEYSEQLCRTQLQLRLPGAADYFLQRPAGNHHILVAGDHFALLRELCETLQFKPIW